jgi:hypothetical protein
MVKISEIVNQNPWWKHGERFVIFDKNLKEANEKLIFFKRRIIGLKSTLTNRAHPQVRCGLELSLQTARIET